ncbi:MAG: 50S ribosomal protein L10 [Verrucomicrobiales bacterium]|nr:50S ribosomal protein L10 [Verrucomicrobiae bacterium]MCC6882744.1 50S ribosomal protein L10 [Verrucomicrobiales bacterium]MCP5555105.1 50S ribosomal protein L10 [Akkermansiaceae bacterium]HRX54293.1 50S ribosomal protein L10 [Verrucomicrobiales bacterium]
MKALKQIVIDDILTRLNGSPFLIVAEYTGMNTGNFATLRQRLLAIGAEFHVTKNTFVKRAAEAAGVQDGLSKILVGQTGTITGDSDVCAAAKIVKDFHKETGKAQIKGGALDGAVLEAAQVEALAGLPSKDVLRAQLLGLLQTPATQLVRVLNEPAASLARVLKAHGEKEAS